jgi:hypothetical protein
MVRKSHASEHDRRNTMAAKHYEFRNRAAQTQALPGQYICCTRNGTLYKPEVPFAANDLNSVIPMRAQKPIQLLESDNKMVASQKSFFSRLVSDQNLASRFIFRLQQTLV